MYMKSRPCEVKSHCQFTHHGQSKHLGNVICWTWLYYIPISPIPPWNCFIYHATPCNRNVHIYAHWCRKVVIEYLTYELWYLRYGSTVSRQCSIWSVLGFFFPFFKIENDQQQGVKSDPGLTPLFLVQGPPKCIYNATNWLCLLKSIIIKHTYLHCWLKKGLLDIYLIFLL